MATLRIKTADAIIFQLIRSNLKGVDAPARQWQEVAVYAMAVKPATIRYSDGSRSVINQTEPDAGFVDRFGARLVSISMQGTFGLQPRRSGLLLKDGYTRLLEFRDECFRRSQQARALSTDGAAQFVYAINYYDFINSEQFSINLDTFTRDLDARRNAYEPTYQLTFTALGQPIKGVQSRDPLLIVLLAVSGFFDTVTGFVNGVMSDPTVQAINGVGDLLPALAGTLTNIASLKAMYATAIAGQLSKTGPVALQAAQVKTDVGTILSLKA